MQDIHPIEKAIKNALDSEVKRIIEEEAVEAGKRAEKRIKEKNSFYCYCCFKSSFF